MPSTNNTLPELTLENIFAKRAFDQKGVGTVRWMKDNAGYSMVEGGKKPEIVRYEAKSGKRSILITTAQLTPAGKTEPLKVDDYQWSTSGAQLLIFTNTEKVWRYNTRGDYWVLNLASGELKQLGKSRNPQSLMFAKFSPDETRVAYVSEFNVYVEDLSTGTITQLTTDGGGNIINGTFDWVYEEELSCRDGFRWSPDSKTIAFWQSDTRDIGTFYLIDNISGTYSQPIPLPYPKVGEKLSAVKIGVVDSHGGEIRWFDIPGDPADNYLARMEFIPNSNEVMIQQLNRRQNTNWVWIGDVQSMKIKNILTEKDRAFLDIHDDIRWLEGETWFTWTSERNGWRHLYRVSRDGKKIRAITNGDYDVIRVNCIDSLGGYVYYTASPDSAIDRYLYRTRLKGAGEPEKMTPEGSDGHHAYQMSEDGEWAIHTASNAMAPNTISVVQVADQTTTKVLQDNRLLQKKIAHLELSPKEFFKVDIGNETLDAYMIKPPGFDPLKKYPVIFYIYGEPAGSTVQNNWDGAGGLWHQYLAQSGMIVISIDNRGTAVPRGRAWRKSIYRQIGILATDDQAKAASEIFRMFPFIDSERVGIWGWSGGGSMTLNCMFRHPEIFKCGIAISFVADQKLYDATYQERYMGLLSDNAKGYREGSPIQHAKNLTGKLMLIHGTADDNVHYQCFELLADELIKQNKLFEMMSYPNRSHSISERDGTALHLRRTMEKFWIQNLSVNF